MLYGGTLPFIKLKRKRAERKPKLSEAYEVRNSRKESITQKPHPQGKLDKSKKKKGDGASARQDHLIGKGTKTLRP